MSKTPKISDIKIVEKDWMPEGKFALVSTPEPKDYNIDRILGEFLIIAKETISGEPDPQALKTAKLQLSELITKEAEIYPEKGIGSLKAVRAVPLEVIERLFNRKEK